jgi:hypothetical protein
MRKRRLTQHRCEKCGKHIDITIAPYLRGVMRKQGKLCECEDD